jgi:hypothetical protein
MDGDTYGSPIALVLAGQLGLVAWNPTSERPCHLRYTPPPREAACALCRKRRRRRALCELGCERCGVMVHDTCYIERLAPDFTTRHPQIVVCQGCRS